MTDTTDIVWRLRKTARRGISVWGDLQMEAADTIERQAARIAELERDAARYRNLRRGQHWSVIDGIGDVLRADELDAAIDAAMGAK